MRRKTNTAVVIRTMPMVRAFEPEELSFSSLAVVDAASSTTGVVTAVWLTPVRLLLCSNCLFMSSE